MKILSIFLMVYLLMIIWSLAMLRIKYGFTIVPEIVWEDDTAETGTGLKSWMHMILVCIQNGVSLQLLLSLIFVILESPIMLLKIYFKKED